MSSLVKPVIFISYSHKDQPDRFLEPGTIRWLSYVKSFLDPAAAHGIVELWDDRRIDGGGNWRREIEEALERCAVCVFLVSRHSLSSQFILDVEMRRMLEHHHARGGHLYPIVITPSDLGVAPWLLELNLKPTNGTALELYPIGPRSQIMSELAAEIRNVIERAASSPPETPVLKCLDTATILVVSSAPIGGTRIQGHNDDLSGILRAAYHRPVRLERLVPPTYVNLRRRLRGDDVRIVHVVCACDADGVVLEQPDAREAPVTADGFAEAFEDSGVELVVFNSSAEDSLRDALLKTCPCVISLARAPEGQAPHVDATEELYSLLAAGDTPARAAALMPAFRADGAGAAEKVAALSQGSGRATLAPEDGSRSQARGPFFGREAELLQAYQVLRFPSSKSFLGVTGLAGSGKTAFVQEVRRRYGYLFPDGVAYLALGEDLKLDVILSTALTQVMPEVLPQFEGNAKDAALNRLSKGQFLLILDDVEKLSDPDATLLQESLTRWDTRAGGRVILIMRERREQLLPLIASNWINIGLMPHKDCKQFFIEALGGYEQALEIVGADLDRVPDLLHEEEEGD